MAYPTAMSSWAITSTGRRRVRVWCLLGTAAAFLGCGGRAPPGPSVALSGFEVFRDLEQVHLGMRVSELRRVRPGIATAPYSGARENVGGDTVWYFLDKPSDREPQPGRDQLAQLSRSRVVGAAITRRAPSAASADSLAQDWVSRLGTPSGCFLYHYSDVSNEVAVFEEPGRTVYITKRPSSRITHSNGTLELPSAVQLLIAVPDSRAVPQAPRWEQVDCQLLFASARNEPARPTR